MPRAIPRCVRCSNVIFFSTRFENNIQRTLKRQHIWIRVQMFAVCLHMAYVTPPILICVLSHHPFGFHALWSWSDGWMLAKYYRECKSLLSSIFDSDVTRDGMCVFVTKRYNTTIVLWYALCNDMSFSKFRIVVTYVCARMYEDIKCTVYRLQFKIIWPFLITNQQSSCDGTNKLIHCYMRVTFNVLCTQVNHTFYSTKANKLYRPSPCILSLILQVWNILNNIVKLCGNNADFLVIIPSSMQIWKPPKQSNHGKCRLYS